jgi:hypothetical protein
MINKSQPAKPVGLLPFNRRRIIDLAIRQVDFLERWIADPFTPPENIRLFESRLITALSDQHRALQLKAKLPPEWVGPQQPKLL